MKQKQNSPEISGKRHGTGGLSRSPGLFRMIRAPFLTSILSPLIFGTLLAAHLNGHLDSIAFVLLLIMGLALHAATNVYNDIYDTRQGTDRINLERNPFSGGSGLLVQNPKLEGRMFLAARVFLVLAVVSALILGLRTGPPFSLGIWAGVFSACFLSKYYTAPPVKLAYRGFGEIAVWSAFGPMAVAAAVWSQSMELTSVALAAMPVTGISTLSILLLGQMIDREADKKGGKWGIAVRGGLEAAWKLYITVQAVCILNTLLLGFLVGAWLLPAAALYLLILPRILSLVHKKGMSPEILKAAAGLNVRLHLIFSLLLNIGMAIVLFIG